MGSNEKKISFLLDERQMTRAGAASSRDSVAPTMSFFGYVCVDLCLFAPK